MLPSPVITCCYPQDPSGFFVRRVLQPFMDEAGNRLRSADMRDPVSLLNPLGMQGGMALLPMPKQIFLGKTLALVNRLCKHRLSDCWL